MSNLSYIAMLEKSENVWKVEKRLIMSNQSYIAMLEKLDNVWKGWKTSDYVGDRQSRNLRKGQKTSDNLK